MERITRYTSETFVQVLSAVLVLLIVVNVLYLFRGYVQGFVTIGLQVVVLTALRQRWPQARTLVRMWALLLVFSGLFGLFVAAIGLATQDLSDPGRPTGMWRLLSTLHLGTTAGGILVFVLSGRHILTEERPLIAEAS